MMNYDAHIPTEYVPQVDAAIATIRDSVNNPISDIKEALQSGESPEHLFMRCQTVTHNDVHRMIDNEDVPGCALIGQTIAHLLIRVAKLELGNDARATDPKNYS